ncbi:hypothetical protein [Neisseria sp. HMSC064E01]|jgi:hypothetical protein|uniref:hypothetical protein n=1 Tax=Neisseria sp. HMSC064E01 TaxID=1715052 RepID=UPI0008A0FE49|nr:hypothetical protein [Neisseria sp. HMSC064E01]OFN82862.1 hypothetical protein HMPREF2572_03960 [Neisseria sp. HMSC064E01]DAK54230.1 MAG TPA: hypothetical protein [Caudoviricetes sp.]
MTLKLLTNKWVLSGLAAILALILAASYQQGYKTAYQKQQAVIDKMEKDKADALRLSAQNYARELEQARADAKQSEAKAHAVGVALAQKQAEVSRLKTENKKEISHVLTQDRQNASGSCIDGFGHHGLQLYNRALGYGN